MTLPAGTSLGPYRILAPLGAGGRGVFAFPVFVQRGDVQTTRIVGVPGVDAVSRPIGPFNLQAGEIFKIRGGRIHEIEANGIVLPYGSTSGWVSR